MKKQIFESILIVLLILTALASAALNIKQKNDIGKLNFMLNEKGKQISLNNRNSFLDEGMIEELKKNGLVDPVAQIVNDLASHPEIIDEEGVVGGTMGFYDKSGIVILNERWVYAPYDDGHIIGYLIAEYNVAKGGKIKWKLVSKYIG